MDQALEYFLGKNEDNGVEIEDNANFISQKYMISIGERTIEKLDLEEDI